MIFEIYDEPWVIGSIVMDNNDALVAIYSVFNDRLEVKSYQILCQMDDGIEFTYPMSFNYHNTIHIKTFTKRCFKIINASNHTGNAIIFVVSKTSHASAAQSASATKQSRYALIAHVHQPD